MWQNEISVDTDPSLGGTYVASMLWGGGIFNMTNYNENRQFIVTSYVPYEYSTLDTYMLMYSTDSNFNALELGTTIYSAFYTDGVFNTIPAVASAGGFCMLSNFERSCYCDDDAYGSDCLNSRLEYDVPPRLFGAQYSTAYQYDNYETNVEQYDYGRMMHTSYFENNWLCNIGGIRYGRAFNRRYVMNNIMLLLVR